MNVVFRNFWKEKPFWFILIDLEILRENEQLLIDIVVLSFACEISFNLFFFMED